MKSKYFDLDELNLPLTDNVLAELNNNAEGPGIIICAAIHGNEPSGVIAIRRVIQFIEKNRLNFYGRLLTLTGNVGALNENVRFLDVDMNRLWSKSDLKRIIRSDSDVKLLREEKEVKQLYVKIKYFGKRKFTGKYFIDLHSTSSAGTPFFFMDKNKKSHIFTQSFPAPSIEGLSGFLRGTLVNFTTKEGFISVIFEGGQHYASTSVQVHESFLWLALVKTGFLNKEDIDIERYTQILKSNTDFPYQKFRVYYRYAIAKNERFEMLNGFKNFDKVYEGDVLARNRSGNIECLKTGRIFMPLYQPQGNDGFFIIRLM